MAVVFIKSRRLQSAPYLPPLLLLWLLVWLLLRTDELDECEEGKDEDDEEEDEPLPLVRCKLPAHTCDRINRAKKTKSKDLIQPHARDPPLGCCW